MQRARKRTDPEAFVRALAPALRQSASIARALEGRVANRPKPGEATAVKAALTIADTASQEALLVPLLEHFPTVRLAAEEDTPSTIQFASEGPELVVIDPIDGTLRFYLEGLRAVRGDDRPRARARVRGGPRRAAPRRALSRRRPRPGRAHRAARLAAAAGARRGDREAGLRLAHAARAARESLRGAASRS